MGNESIIMVVPRGVLFGKDYFEGFKNFKEVDFESRILNNFLWMKRNEAEQNTNFKQPSIYSIIVNPGLRQVFVYQRSTQDKDYPEKKLQGKWSLGVGGHIEKCDADKRDILRASMTRELNEEVEITGSVCPKQIGYINNDSIEVDKYHFGILYLIETDSEIIKPKSLEIANGSLRTIEELESICSSAAVEEWSRIALKPIKEYFDKI